MVSEQNFDRTFESQVKGNQVLAAPATANTIDTPSTSEVNSVQNHYNIRGGKFNLRTNPNPIYLDVYRY